MNSMFATRGAGAIRHRDAVARRDVGIARCRGRPCRAPPVASSVIGAQEAVDQVRSRRRARRRRARGRARRRRSGASSAGRRRSAVSKKAMFGCARARSSSARSISRPVTSRWWRIRRRVWPPSRPRSKPLPAGASASAGSKSHAELHAATRSRRAALDHVAARRPRGRGPRPPSACRARGRRRSRRRRGRRRCRPAPSSWPNPSAALLGDDRHAAVLGDAQRVEQAGEPAAEDQEIEIALFRHRGAI